MENHNDGLRTISDWFLDDRHQHSKCRYRALIIGAIFAGAYFFIRILEAYMDGRFPCPK